MLQAQQLLELLSSFGIDLGGKVRGRKERIVRVEFLASTLHYYTQLALRSDLNVLSVYWHHPLYLRPLSRTSRHPHLQISIDLSQR